MKTIIGTAAVAALGLVALTTTAHYASAQAAPAQAPAGKKAKAVKDTGEYDIYNEVIKDAAANPPNGKKFVADLDTWTQKYPNTDFADRRGMYYIQAYAANNQLNKALDAAKPLVDKGVDALKEGLENDGYVLQTLFLTARATAALTATGTPTPDELATGAKASQMLIDFGKLYFAPDKKPANMTADQWSAGLKQITDQADGTLFAIADYPGNAALKANPKDPAANATAEEAYKQALTKYPNSGVLANQIAAAALIQQASSPAKPQEALFYFARAASMPTGGPGNLDANGQKAVDAYLTKVYGQFHGSDEGLQALKDLAAKNITPPADFKIQTAAEVAAAADEEFRTKNPQLAMWMGIKGQLAGDNGQQYFEDQLKEHDMSGENGAKLLKGTLVEAKPACNPKELLVAVKMPNASNAPNPEITLKLDAPLKGKPETGGDVEFNGVPSAFTKDPFMLTMDSAKDKIDGLTLSACTPTPARGRAPAKKGQ